MNLTEDFREKFRQFMDHSMAESERSMVYWSRVPPYRFGDTLLQRAQELVECLTKGKGDIQLVSMDLAFLAFVMSEKGTEIRQVLDRIKGAPIVEVHTEDEQDKDKPSKKSKNSDSWRG